MLNTSNLYGSEWLAVVFSNRNKNYGAYVLRTQSSNILLKSLLIVAPFFIMLFIGPMIYAQLNKKIDVAPVKEVPVTLTERVHELKKEEPKKEEPKQQEPAPVKQVQVKQTNFSANIKVVDEPVDEPPTMADLKNSVIASSTQDGAAATGNAQPEPAAIGGGGGTSDNGVSATEIYDVGGVETYPEFPGGMDAWAKFIQKNLRYPYAAQEAGVQGKVFVSFVVERDGSISDVKVARGIGFGCDDEAVRVIKKSPRWKAGQQNKQNVRVRYNMPINYLLSQ